LATGKRLGWGVEDVVADTWTQQIDLAQVWVDQTTPSQTWTEN
jgi:hypothetical protein